MIKNEANKVDEKNEIRQELPADKLEIKVRRVRVTTNSKAGAAEFDGRTW